MIRALLISQLYLKILSLTGNPYFIRRQSECHRRHNALDLCYLTTNLYAVTVSLLPIIPSFMYELHSVCASCIDEEQTNQICLA